MDSKSTLEILQAQLTQTKLPMGGGVTVGNFDGVHRGHQHLLRSLRKLSSGPVRVITFDVHPSTILRPDSEHRVITTLQEKVRLLYEAGADEVFVLTTSRELLDLPAEEFFATVWAAFMPALWLGGLDFRFGRNRAGTMELLHEWMMMRGGQAVIAQEIVDELTGERISSTAIRAALDRGDVKQAVRLLGRAGPGLQKDDSRLL